MKFSLHAQDFRRALHVCSEIAPATSKTFDEKTGVLIKAEEGQVILTASDDYTSVKVEVPAQVDAPGEALVKCHSVSSSVAATFTDNGFDGAPTRVVVAKTGKSTLKVSGGNQVAEGKALTHVRNFPLLNTDFFADALEFNPSKATQIPVFHLIDGLTKVHHAASKDIGLPHFNCVALTMTDHEVIFAATDGIQIAEYRKSADVKGLRGTFLLGLKFAALAAKLVNPSFDFADIYVEQDRLFLKSGGITLVGTLVKADFPDYRPVLALEQYKRASFPLIAFSSVVSGMQPTVDLSSHRVVLVAKRSGTATLSTSSISGEAESSDLEVETPEDFVLHFDSVLLQGILRQLSGENFDFYFKDGSKGVVFCSPKSEEFTAYMCTLKKID